VVQAGEHYVRHEATNRRADLPPGRDVDGIERIERFDDDQALVDRQRELEITVTTTD